jgi:hypothetical protein
MYVIHLIILLNILGVMIDNKRFVLYVHGIFAFERYRTNNQNCIFMYIVLEVCVCVLVCIYVCWCVYVCVGVYMCVLKCICVCWCVYVCVREPVDIVYSSNKVIKQQFVNNMQIFTLLPYLIFY